MKVIKAGTALGPNVLPNRVLRYKLKREMKFLTKAFNAVLSRQYKPPGKKHARLISVLKTGKEVILPSSYKQVSLLDTVANTLRRTVLTRVYLTLLQTL
jgi:hypothetical protein